MVPSCLSLGGKEGLYLGEKEGLSLEGKEGLSLGGKEALSLGEKEAFFHFFAFSYNKSREHSIHVQSETKKVYSAIFLG